MPSGPFKIVIKLSWDDAEKPPNATQIEIIRQQMGLHFVAVQREAQRYKRQYPDWRQSALVGIQSGLLDSAKKEIEATSFVRNPFAYNLSLGFRWDGRQITRNAKLQQEFFSTEEFQQGFVRAVSAQLDADLLSEISEVPFIKLLPDGYRSTNLSIEQKTSLARFPQSQRASQAAAIIAPRRIGRKGVTFSLHPLHWHAESGILFFPLDILIHTSRDFRLSARKFSTWPKPQQERWMRLYAELRDELDREAKRIDPGRIQIDTSFAHEMTCLSAKFGDIRDDLKAAQRIKDMSFAQRAEYNLLHVEAAELTEGIDPQEKLRVLHKAETTANLMFHDAVSGAERMAQPEIIFPDRPITTENFQFSDEYREVTIEGRRYRLNDRQAAFLRELATLPDGKSKHYKEIFRTIGLEDENITGPYKLFQRGGKDGLFVFIKLIRSKNGRYSIIR